MGRADSEKDLTSYIGLQLPEFCVDIDRVALERFADAIGERDPHYREEVAPPTFLKVVEGHNDSSRKLLELMDVDLRRVLHAGQRFEYFHPIRPGDRLAVVREVTDVVSRSVGDFVYVGSIFTNRAGRRAAKSVQSILIRKPAKEQRIAKEPVVACPQESDDDGGYRTIAEEARERWSLEDLVRYAEASGDRNPLHTDPAFARAAGFEAPVVHGMLVMAALGRLLTQTFPAVGLKVFEVTFKKPLLMGQGAILCAKAREHGEGETEVALECRAIADNRLVARGTAMVGASGASVH